MGSERIPRDIDSRGKFHWSKLATVQGNGNKVVGVEVPAMGDGEYTVVIYPRRPLSQAAAAVAYRLSYGLGGGGRIDNVADVEFYNNLGANPSYRLQPVGALGVALLARGEALLQLVAVNNALAVGTEQEYIIAAYPGAPRVSFVPLHVEDITLPAPPTLLPMFTRFLITDGPSNNFQFQEFTGSTWLTPPRLVEAGGTSQSPNRLPVPNQAVSVGGLGASFVAVAEVWS